MDFNNRFVSPVILLILLQTPLLYTADLIEPWDPGFSDAEFYLATAEESGNTSWAAVAGFGAGKGFSLGVLLSHFNGGSTRIGGLAVWSTSISDSQDLDLWAVTEVFSDREADPERINLEVGAEWSFRTGSAQLYIRPSFFFDGDGGHWHPLVGIMQPVGPVELHLELSSFEPQGGRWPIHLAIGPNFEVSNGVEILPEINLIHGGEPRQTTWVAVLGIVVDPRIF